MAQLDAAELVLAGSRRHGLSWGKLYTQSANHATEVVVKRGVKKGRPACRRPPPAEFEGRPLGLTPGATQKKAIGQVILDKNPCLKTIVTKIGSLSNEFRTFDMEVIAGRDDTDVTVCERGLKLRFDFRTVYWNSRLSEERVRMLAQVDPSDVICDLFAGAACARTGAALGASCLERRSGGPRPSLRSCGSATLGQLLGTCGVRPVHEG